MNYPDFAARQLSEAMSITEARLVLVSRGDLAQLLNWSADASDALAAPPSMPSPRARSAPFRRRSMNLIDRLAGYKTYITAATTTATATVAALHGGVSPLQAALAGLIAVSVAFARAGSKQDALRSAAIVVSELAPVAAAVLPNASGIAKAVGDAAASAAAEIAAPVAAAVAAPVAAAVADVAAPAPAVETAAPAVAAVQVAPELVDAVLTALVTRMGGATATPASL